MPPVQVYPRACGGTAPTNPRTNPMLARSIPAPAGEPSTQNSHSYQAPGLSPRLRGNRMGRSTHWPWTWSIPAPAGEPLWRGCGHGLSDGLSPRLRGNPA